MSWTCYIIVPRLKLMVETPMFRATDFKFRECCPRDMPPIAGLLSWLEAEGIEYEIVSATVFEENDAWKPYKDYTQILKMSQQSEEKKHDRIY